MAMIIAIIAIILALVAIFLASKASRRQQLDWATNCRKGSGPGSFRTWPARHTGGPSSCALLLFLLLGFFGDSRSLPLHGWQNVALALL